jgi:hypothetical protein
MSHVCGYLDALELLCVICFNPCTITPNVNRQIKYSNMYDHYLEQITLPVLGSLVISLDMFPIGKMDDMSLFSFCE